MDSVIAPNMPRQAPSLEGLGPCLGKECILNGLAPWAAMTAPPGGSLASRLAYRLWSKKTPIRILLLLLSGFATSGKSQFLSEPQFPGGKVGRLHQPP